MSDLKIKLSERIKELEGKIQNLGAEINVDGTALHQKKTELEKSNKELGILLTAIKALDAQGL